MNNGYGFWDFSKELARANSRREEIVNWQCDGRDCGQDTGPDPFIKLGFMFCPECEEKLRESVLRHKAYRKSKNQPKVDLVSKIGLAFMALTVTYWLSHLLFFVAKRAL